MAMPQPNILLLTAEDTGKHHGCYGEPYAYTPRIDALAAAGCRYDRMYSTYPVCAPSRSSFVTGQYPWSIGTHQMRSTLLNPPPLVTQTLREAGYFVSWPSKTDFNFTPPPQFADQTKGEWTQDLKAGRLPDQPFLLFHNFSVTHESTMWTSDFERSPGGAAERKQFLSLVPDSQRHQPDRAPVPPYLPDVPDVRGDIARYFDALSIQDAQVGQVLDALDASPYRDNTVVIYLGDHGRGLVREKRWCYAAGLNVPLIIRWPGKIQPGSFSTELVSGVDLAPTLLSIAGVAIPKNYQGQAILGASRSSAPRQYVFAGRDRMDETFDRVRVCRNDRFHYIRNYYPQLPYAQRNLYMEHQLTTRAMRELDAGGKFIGPTSLWMQRSKPPEELYDALSDPHMINNLAGQNEYAHVLTELRSALDDHIAAVGDLGAVPERELIARGLVEDRLDEFRKRIAPLPAQYSVGRVDCVLEPHEADAWQSK